MVIKVMEMVAGRIGGWSEMWLYRERLVRGTADWRLIVEFSVAGWL